MIKPFKKIKATFAPRRKNLTPEEITFVGQQAYFMPYQQIDSLKHPGVTQWRFAVCLPWLHELANLGLNPREFCYVDEDDLIIIEE